VIPPVGRVCPAAARMAAILPMFRGLFGRAGSIDARNGSTSRFRICGVNAGHRAGRRGVASVVLLPGRQRELTYQRQWEHATLGAFGNFGTGYYNDAPSDQSPWINRWDVVPGRLRPADRSPHDVQRRRQWATRRATASATSAGASSTAGNIQQIPGLDYTVAKQPTLNLSGHVGVLKPCRPARRLSYCDE
jgi:hypothetical protein